jgi:plastocyanin
MKVQLLRFLKFSLLLSYLSIALPSWLVGQHVTTARIQSAKDDAEEAGLNTDGKGTVYLYNADLELVEDPQNERGQQYVGLRFASVALPAGAEVVKAYLQFTCDETDALPGEKVIRMENDTSPVSFEFLPFNVSNRAMLADSVVWRNLPAWNKAGDAGPAQRSPNLARLVQQMVDRPGWQAGQAMAFVLTGTGTRVADSYDGDPMAAPQLVVEYLDGTYPMGTFPISRKSVWKYATGPAAPASDWMTPTYNDSQWAFGLGVLGYGHASVHTTLDFGPDSTQKYLTSYYRHVFDVSQADVADSLIMRSLYDDGIVVYLNGVELFRDNLAPGPIGPQDSALQPVSGYLETAYRERRLPATLLAGTNVLAVEVHQSSAADPDLLFDLEVFPARHPLGATELPILPTSEWAYRDSVVNLDGSNWTLPSYDDRDWAYGAGPLGYGNGQVATGLSFGNNPNSKPLTAYFRREVWVDAVADLSDSLLLALRRDDGAVVYINGQEAWRSNMPVGLINAGTPAATVVSGADHGRYFTHPIARGYFQDGLNVIAVEVHQHSATDADLIFDLEVRNLLGSHSPGVAFSADRTEVLAGGTVTFTNETSPWPDTLIWKFSGGTILNPGSDQPQVRYDLPGTYDVALITATQGAGRDTLVKVDYITVTGSVAVASPSSEGLRLYPNPVQERLTIDLTLAEAQTVSAELWTLDGRLLTRWTPRRLAAGDNLWSLDLSAYQGVLALRVRTDTQQVSRIIRIGTR